MSKQFMIVAVLLGYFAMVAPLVVVAQPPSDLPYYSGGGSADSYEVIYKQAVSQNRPVVFGVDVTPPAGNWFAAQVRSVDVGFKPGEVIVAQAVGNTLVLRAKIAAATAEAVKTTLEQTPTPTITYYQAPAQQAPMTYYQSAPVFYSRPGLFGGRLFGAGGGCSGLGGGCGG